MRKCDMRQVSRCNKNECVMHGKWQGNKSKFNAYNNKLQFHFINR